MLELVVIVGFAVALALVIQAFLVKPFQIPSGSMIPTLEIGQRVLVNRTSVHFGNPSQGDIVVFHPPKGNRCAPGADEANAPCAMPFDERSEENFIKRVVAVGGDTIKIEGGVPIVNGEPLEEDYTTACGDFGSRCDLPKEITVPPDHYFMMGDNRGQSDDSRFWGPVPEEWVVGKAFATYWPPNRIGIF
ncbi:MAG: signal peptidase I [Solirubrobacterales bacterium]